MKHKQHPNAFAYVMYERPNVEVIRGENPVEWIRSVMFYADDPAHSDRDAVWEYNVGWRDPNKIRIVPLFDEAGNVAMREAHLEDINARYMAETVVERKIITLKVAVDTALEECPVSVRTGPEGLERYEGLVKTVQAFESQLMAQLLVPFNTVQRKEYLPSAEQLEALNKFTKE